MTIKKADVNKTVDKQNTTTSGDVKKQHTTPDIFSLSEPTAKKEAVKVEAKKAPEKKVEVKETAKVEKKVAKPKAKKVVKAKKTAPKKVVKHVEAKKPVEAKKAVQTTEKKAVVKAKKEVNKAVNSLFDVVANMFEDINENMWSFSKEVSDKKFNDLTNAFDHVEKVMQKSSSIIEEDKKNREAIASSSDVINKKSKELNDEIITFCEQVFDNHMENANLLMACKDLEDLQSARNEIYERDIEKLFDRANKNADIWFGMIENSFEPLQKRADEISEKIIFRIL